MAWSNKHLNINGSTTSNGKITVNGVTPNYVNVTMNNGVTIIDGWSNSISPGTVATIWRKEFTASFSNYDSVSSAISSSKTLYYGISATDSGVSAGTPYKNKSDYITYSNGRWSPTLATFVYGNTTYTAEYDLKYFCILELTSVNASQSINSTDSDITYSDSGNTRRWRIPCDLKSVSITYTPSTNYGYDGSGSKTVTYDVSSAKTITDTQNPNYAYVFNPMNSTSLDNANNCSTGYHKIGSVLQFTYIPKSYTLTTEISKDKNSSTSTNVNSAAPIIQTTIALCSQCAFTGSNSSTSNETVSKTITGYVYRKRTQYTTVDDTLSEWTLNDATYTTSAQFTFTLSSPSVFGYKTSGTKTTITYSDWEYTGGSEITLPSASDLSSRTYTSSTYTTFKWSMSNVVHLDSQTGTIVTSPYTVTGSQTTTYTPNTSNKWYSVADSSETYALGAKYTIPTTRVTSGKLITLRLDGTAATTYTTAKTPTPTLTGTQIIRTVTIYPAAYCTESDFSDLKYIGSMTFNNKTLTKSGYTEKYYGLSTPSGWSWKSSTSGISYDSLTSVPLDGSTYTASEKSAIVSNPTYTVPTTGSATYGSYAFLSTSNVNLVMGVTNKISGTVKLTSNKTYYAWYRINIPPIVGEGSTNYNAVTRLLTITIPITNKNDFADKLLGEIDIEYNYNVTVNTRQIYFNSPGEDFAANETRNFVYQVFGTSLAAIAWDLKFTHTGSNIDDILPN